LDVLLLDATSILFRAIFIFGNGCETGSSSIVKSRLQNKNSVHVSMCAQILNLGFSENYVRVRSRRLVYIGTIDDEQDCLNYSDADAADSLNGLETQLREQLASFLLRAGLLSRAVDLLGESGSFSHLSLFLADLLHTGSILFVTALRAVVRLHLILELLLFLSSSLLSLSLGLDNHD
ncbi:hypothetical protein PMAYCL1PPCAC_23404, partial [Pristionchus mayeri]